MPIIALGLKSVTGLAPIIGGNSVTSLSNTCRVIVSGAILVMLAWPVFADDRSALERQIDSVCSQFTPVISQKRSGSINQTGV